MQTLYLLNQHKTITKKSLQLFNQIIIIIEKNVIVIRDSKNFLF